MPTWTQIISALSGNLTSRTSGRRYMMPTAKSCGWKFICTRCNLYLERKEQKLPAEAQK